MKNETADALALANKILSRIAADPDDDLAVLARQFERAHEHNTQLQMTGTEQVSQYRQLQRKYDEIVAVLIAAKVPVRTITETVIHPQIKIRDRMIEQLKTENAELALTLKRTLDIVNEERKERHDG